MEPKLSGPPGDPDCRATTEFVMCVLVLFGIRKDFIVWIKYFDIRTSMMLVGKVFCLGLLHCATCGGRVSMGIFYIRVYVMKFTTLTVAQVL